MNECDDPLKLEAKKNHSSSGSYAYCPYEYCKYSATKAKVPPRQDNLGRHIRTKHRLEESGLRAPGAFKY